MDTVAKRIRSELPSPPQSNDGELCREASLDPSGALRSGLPPLYNHSDHLQPAIAANGEPIAGDPSVSVEASIVLTMANNQQAPGSLYYPAEDNYSHGLPIPRPVTAPPCPVYSAVD